MDSKETLIMKRTARHNRTYTIVTVISFIIITGVSALIVQQFYSFQVRQAEQIHAEEIKRDREQCISAANNKYGNAIKAQGTPMTISGQDYSGLSNDQWTAINNQRLVDTKKCEAIK